MLIKCPSCGTPVSDKAAKCPKCGTSLEKESIKQEWSGIETVINKLDEVKKRFPDAPFEVAVFPDNFSVEPLIHIFPPEPSEENDTFLIQVFTNIIMMMNRVDAFDSLSFAEEFYTSDGDSPYQKGSFAELDSDDILNVNAPNASVAAKIVFDLLTIVYSKQVSKIRLTLTPAFDDANNAKYNSDGEFLEGTGYGQGEFAFYDTSSANVPANNVNSGGYVEEDSSVNVGKIIGWIIGIIVFIIYMII